MLLGGKRPVHNHSSSQPLSSLYLWEKDQSDRDHAPWSYTFYSRTRTDTLS